MAEIIFRLPSKAVQYGYVEVHATPEELGFESVAEPEILGAIYVTYVASFVKGEKGGLDRFLLPTPEEASKAFSEPPPGGKKPRAVDEASEMATQLLQSELGATVVSEHTHTFAYVDDENGKSGSYCSTCEEEEPVENTDVPPWKKKASPQAKPWESKSTTSIPNLSDLF